MKISELYGYIDKVKPNAFDAAVKNMWLNEVEGAVQSQVMLLAPSEAVVYAYDPEDAETDAELLVGAPYNKLYYAYLTAMIDFANGEYSNYSNTLTLFNTFWNEYAAWYSLNIHPADGRAVYEGYYLSAYGIAVRHGYTGSEDEWLADLKGENGPKGDAGKDGITPHVGENGNWYIGDTDSGVRAQGDTGPKGDTGPAGPKGDTGAAATDTQVAAAVDTWLDEHPEAVAAVADGSVTPAKTTFFDIVKKSSANLIDPDAIEVGTIDTSTGADAVSGVHRRTAYISVEPGHYLYPQDGEALLSGSYVFYASTGAYLSTGANALPVTVPASAQTVRITWLYTSSARPFLGESAESVSGAMAYEEYGERTVSATVKPENLPADYGTGGGVSLGMTAAAVGQIAKITAVDGDGVPTAWEPVDMPSGGDGSKPHTSTIMDVTLTEAVSVLTQTLAHNYFRLHCIINSGADGVTLTVDDAGAPVGSVVAMLISTTSISFNVRKVAQLGTNTATWKSYQMHAEWSADLSHYVGNNNAELAVGTFVTPTMGFGGVTSMLGTLGPDAKAPNAGETINIVCRHNINAGVRVIVWGEYYT